MVDRRVMVCMECVVTALCGGARRIYAGRNRKRWSVHVGTVGTCCVNCFRMQEACEPRRSRLAPTGNPHSSAVPSIAALGHDLDSGDASNGTLSVGKQGGIRTYLHV